MDGCCCVPCKIEKIQSLESNLNFENDDDWKHNVCLLIEDIFTLEQKEVVICDCKRFTFDWFMKITHCNYSTFILYWYEDNGRIYYFNYTIRGILLTKEYKSIPELFL